MFTNPSELMGGTQNFANPTIPIKTADFKFGGTSGSFPPYTFNITGCNVTVGPPLTSFTITATAGANGSVTPAGVTNVNSGEGQTYTIAPSTGYHVATVLVDGSSVGAVTSYPFTNVTANHTISASFAINTYTVTFNSNGGSSVSPITGVEYNTAVGPLPFDPTRTGYSFGGWYTDDITFANTFTASSVVTEDITVYAKWTINNYTVTFNSNGGSAVSPITGVEYNTAVGSLPTEPTKTDHVFDGWFADDGTFNNAFTAASIVTGDITVYARWADPPPPPCNPPQVGLVCQPVAQVAIVGENVQFTACADGDLPMSIQWQVSTDNGLTFNDIPGENSSPLTINNVVLSQNGFLYKAKFENTCGIGYSDPAALAVKMLVKDFGPVEIAIGSPTNSNNNQKVDLKVEFFKNVDPVANPSATPICKGELFKQQIVGNAQNNLSKIYTIPLPRLTGENANFAPDDRLYCRVSVQKSAGVTATVSLNMWYDGPPTPGSSQGNKAYSRIWKVTVGGSTQDYYYFHQGSALNAVAGSAATFIPMASVPTSYTPFGTWSILGANMKRGVDGRIIPDKALLEWNYPNPFNPSTTIAYGLPEPSKVHLAVYDVLGREVVTLVDGILDAGYHSAVWNTNNGNGAMLASGVYIYRLAANGSSGHRFTQVRKMVLTK